jgi:hypothetical protein
VATLSAIVATAAEQASADSGLPDEAETGENAYRGAAPQCRGGRQSAHAEAFAQDDAAAQEPGRAGRKIFGSGWRWLLLEPPTWES